MTPNPLTPFYRNGRVDPGLLVLLLKRTLIFLTQPLGNAPPDNICLGGVLRLTCKTPELLCSTFITP